MPGSSRGTLLEGTIVGRSKAAPIANVVVDLRISPGVIVRAPLEDPVYIGSSVTSRNQCHHLLKVWPHCQPRMPIQDLADPVQTPMAANVYGQLAEPLQR
jgi:hypothetical protein